MYNTGIGFLKDAAQRLREPENLYEGLKLPKGFGLPDDILLFYHDFCAHAPNAHCRYTLVFPFSEMLYYVDQQTYTIAPGDLLLIPPYTLRFLSPLSAGYQRLFITFQLKTPQSYLPQSILNHLSERSLEFLKNIFELYSQNNTPALALELYGFLTHLSPGAPGDSRRLSAPIARAAAFINENIHTALTCSAVAARVNMSVSNLNRRFRLEMGDSIHHYIKFQRLEFARHYLQKTLMPVDEIARLCGFLSSSSFIRFFTQANGISPLAYRKNRENSINHILTGENNDTP